MTAPSTADLHTGADPRQLGAILLELALISHRGALFHRFIHDRACEEMEVLEGANEGTQDVIMHGKDKRFYGENGLLVSSGLAKRIRELMNSYLVIDDYLLKQSIEKVNFLCTFKCDCS